MRTVDVVVIVAGDEIVGATHRRDVLDAGITIGIHLLAGRVVVAPAAKSSATQTAAAAVSAAAAYAAARTTINVGTIHVVAIVTADDIVVATNRIDIGDSAVVIAVDHLIGAIISGHQQDGCLQQRQGQNCETQPVIHI